MKATDWLKRDHELILEGLEALTAVARKCRAGEKVSEENVGKLVAFFREFADEYHHHKEEKALFPALEAAGLPPHGPVAVMLHEHDLGRRLLKQMRDSLPELDTDAAMEYVSLLQGHIQKENEILFRMADRLLSPANDLAMTEMFAETEAAMKSIVQEDTHRALFKAIS